MGYAPFSFFQKKSVFHSKIFFKKIKKQAVGDQMRQFAGYSF